MAALLHRLRAHARSEHQLALAGDGPTAPAKLVGVVLLGALSVTLLEYFGTRAKQYRLDPLLELFVEDGKALRRHLFSDPQLGAILADAYWSLSVVLLLGVLPVLFLHLCPPRQRLATIGVRVGDVRKHYLWYLGLFGVMAPVLLWAATTEAFVDAYPLSRAARRSLFQFAVWEALYLPQFLAVELFFRGFLMFPFRRAMGLYAVLVPLIPYVMIHFDKPLPEVLGAAVTHLVLGVLAFSTRSIWLGVALHAGIALSMDVLAMLARGGFP